MTTETDVSAVIEARMAALKDLPTLPVVVFKVMELMKDPDSSMSEIAKIVAADQVLTSKIIRAVNSPLFALPQEIRDVHRAIAYMGLDMVQNIVMTCSLIRHFSGKPRELDMKSFWEHSFGCAILSQLIAKRVGWREIEEAYLAGLLHDIGEVVMATVYVREFPGIIKQARQDGSSLYAAENQALGYSHCEVGRWLAQRWHFPAGVTQAIASHHTPAVESVSQTLVAIVNVADLFCRLQNLGYGYYEKLDVAFEREPGWRILKSNSTALDGVDIERFTYELDTQVDDVRNLVASVY